MPRFSISWVILGAGFLILFFGGGSRYSLGLVLKPMTEDLGWSRSTLSLAATCFMVTSALALPLAGRDGGPLQPALGIGARRRWWWRRASA